MIELYLQNVYFYGFVTYTRHDGDFSNMKKVKLIKLKSITNLFS
jgi:hypothetical protein